MNRFFFTANSQHLTNKISAAKVFPFGILPHFRLDIGIAKANDDRKLKIKNNFFFIARARNGHVS